MANWNEIKVVYALWSNDLALVHLLACTLLCGVGKKRSAVSCPKLGAFNLPQYFKLANLCCDPTSPFLLSRTHTPQPNQQRQNAVPEQQQHKTCAR